MTDPRTPTGETGSYAGRDRSQIWLRGLFMLILAVFFSFAGSLLALLGLVQFGWSVFGNGPNPALRAFGTTLAEWLRQTARFQVFATEDKPFPWTEWPKGG